MCEARRSQLSRVMRRGHELASKMEGDYNARLSLALRLAWKEEKGGDKIMVEFTKKGLDFVVEVKDVKCILKCDGEEVEAKPVKRSNRWGYEIKGGVISKKLIGKDKGIIIAHESAEKLKETIEETKEKSKTNKILNNRITLKFGLGDRHRVHCLKIENYWLSKGDIINHLKDKELMEFLKDSVSSDEQIVSEFSSYFKKENNLITYKNEEVASNIKDENISVKINEFDNLNGKGKYVSEIVFESFSILEKHLRFAFNEKMTKSKKDLNVKNVFKKAKETGERQMLRSWSEPCNDPNEACDIDTLAEYALPNGKTKVVRGHNW